MATTARPDRIAFGELMADFVRGLLATALVLVLLIPAVIIKAADGLTMWRIRRKGGLD